MKIQKIWPLILLLSLSMQSAFAQKKATVYTYEALASDVETDVVVVNKSDHKAVWNLKPSDFRIFEGDSETTLAEQPIREVKIERKPYNLLLVLDASGSMQSSAAMVREAAKKFVDTTEASDRVGVMTFSSSGIELKADLGNKSSPLLMSAIDSYRPNGETPLVDALMQAVAHLERKFPGQRNAVVLLSDGGDNASHVSADQLLAKLKTSEVTVHVLNISEGDQSGRALNLSIAQSSGGAFLDYDSHGQIEAAFKEMAERLRRFYVIYHTPQDEIKSGTMRHIAVKIENGSQYEALYRDHYVARTGTGSGDQVNTDYITHFNFLNPITHLDHLDNPAVELKEDLVVKEGDGFYISSTGLSDTKPAGSYCRFTQSQGGPITLAKGGAISIIGSEYNEADSTFDGTLTANTGMRLPVNFHCKLRNVKGTANIRDLTEILSDRMAFVNIDSPRDNVDKELSHATTLEQKLALTKKSIELAASAGGMSVVAVEGSKSAAGERWILKPSKNIDLAYHDLLSPENIGVYYQGGNAVEAAALNKSADYCELNRAAGDNEKGTVLTLSSEKAYASNSAAYVEHFSDKLDRTRTDYFDEDKKIFYLYCYLQTRNASQYSMNDVNAIIGKNIVFVDSNSLGSKK